MIEIIPFETLGHANHGWLDARHHFSFASYLNRNRMGHPPLRVWNDDTIQGKTGFPMHPHDNMEIITYIREGAITHEDNMGNKGRITKGQIQVMSAGTGVFHSEYNLENEPTTLFQIWIQSGTWNVKPRYETREMPEPDGGEWIILASGREKDKDTNAVMIYQDASLLVGKAETGKNLTYDIPEGRHAYLVPPTGKYKLENEIFSKRDGVYITGPHNLNIEAVEAGTIVLADLPKLDY